jgi:hypothetical protein
MAGYGRHRRRVDPWQKEQEREQQRKADEKARQYHATKGRLLAGLVPIEFYDLRTKYGVNLNDLEREVVATAYSASTGEATAFLSVYPGVGVTETGHISTRVWLDPEFLRKLQEA